MQDDKDLIKFLKRIIKASKKSKPINDAIAQEIKEESIVLERQVEILEKKRSQGRK